MPDNSAYALQYFTQQGWTPEQAAGIVGNLMQESGLNPTVRPGDQGRSQGIAQWNGQRLDALQQFAQQQNSDPRSLDTQLGFIQNELGGSESKAGNALRNAQTINDATSAFAGFERPRGWTSSHPQEADAYDKRLQYAMQALGGDSGSMGIDAPGMSSVTAERAMPLASAAMVTPQQQANPVDAWSQMMGAQDQAMAPLRQPQQASSVPEGWEAAPEQPNKQPAAASSIPDGWEAASDAPQHSDAYNMILRPVKGALAGAVGAIPDMLAFANSAPSHLFTGQPSEGPDVTGKTLDILNKLIPTDQPTTFGGFLGQEAAKAAGGLMVPFGAGKAAAKGESAAAKLLGNEEPLAAVTPKVTPDLPAAAIKPQAQAAYKTAQDIGGTLSPNFRNKLVDFAQSHAPQTEDGLIATGKSDLNEIAKAMETMRDKPMSLQAVQEFDEGLSQRIDGHFQNGRLSKEGKQLFDLQTEFRDMIKNASANDITGGKEGFDALKQGRDLWSQYLKRSDVERLVAKAQDTDQPANALKNVMKRLVNSPRFSSYNKTEQDALKQAAKTGALTGLLRIFGSRLTSIAATGAGFVGGGGIPGALASGAVAEGVGVLARKGAEKLQMNRVNNVYKELTKSARQKGAK